MNFEILGTLNSKAMIAIREQEIYGIAFELEFDFFVWLASALASWLEYCIILYSSLVYSLAKFLGGWLITDVWSKWFWQNLLKTKSNNSKLSTSDCLILSNILPQTTTWLNTFKHSMISSSLSYLIVFNNCDYASILISQSPHYPKISNILRFNNSNNWISFEQYVSNCY